MAWVLTLILIKLTPLHLQNHVNQWPFCKQKMNIFEIPSILLTLVFTIKRRWIFNLIQTSVDSKHGRAKQTLIPIQIYLAWVLTLTIEKLTPFHLQNHVMQWPFSKQTNNILEMSSIVFSLDRAVKCGPLSMLPRLGQVQILAKHNKAIFPTKCARAWSLYNNLAKPIPNPSQTNWVSGET